MALGLVPSLEPATVPDATALTERVLRLLDMLGLDPETVTEPAGDHARLRPRRRLARLGAPRDRPVPRGRPPPLRHLRLNGSCA